MATEAFGSIEHLSLVNGGPFYRLLVRARLIEAHSPHAIIPLEEILLRVVKLLL